MLLFLLSCEENNNRDTSAHLEQIKIKRERREAAIDSVYFSLSEKFKSEKNWEVFNYEYLFELQEYLDSKKGKLTVKGFNDFEIYKKNNSFFCSYRIEEFQNDLIIDLELTKSQLEEFRGKRDNVDYEFYGIAVLNIEKIEPIDFEFQTQMDDYDSRIVIEKYKSLRGKGRIEKIEFVKEKI